ncbi:hypothetical protein CDV36_005868 [Fusarium kuroshium]|uniref:Uncharacterized protein n=1 Tax=Fusarium kuroshium TaxID=2010991 RepID=A0A3M2SA37_9HYPO|nr:hypothetical protein CDV36_005868 [Fusarium kuroshium]
MDSLRVRFYDGSNHLLQHKNIGPSVFIQSRLGHITCMSLQHPLSVLDPRLPDIDLRCAAMQALTTAFLALRGQVSSAGSFA